MIIFPRYLQIALLTLTISGCTAIGINRYNNLHGQPQLQERMVAVDSAIATQYRNAVTHVIARHQSACNQNKASTADSSAVWPSNMATPRHTDKIAEF